MTASAALACAGKSVARSEGDSGGGSAGSGAGARGNSEPSIGSPCQSDYDCLRVDAGASSVVICASSGRCEVGTSETSEPLGCYTDMPPPRLELDDSRVYQNPACSSGICLLRSYSIDPANTMCTSRCATDADCAAPYAVTSDCMPTEIYENGDTGVIVNVCMPPMPW
jgi:hypothetical protein